MSCVTMYVGESSEQVFGWRFWEKEEIARSICGNKALSVHKGDAFGGIGLVVKIDHHERRGIQTPFSL